MQQFQTIQIFSNENINIGDKTVYCKTCFENGINSSTISQTTMVVFIHMMN